MKKIAEIGGTVSFKTGGACLFEEEDGHFLEWITEREEVLGLHGHAVYRMFVAPDIFAAHPKFIIDVFCRLGEHDVVKMTKMSTSSNVLDRAFLIVMLSRVFGGLSLDPNYTVHTEAELRSRWSLEQTNG